MKILGKSRGVASVIAVAIGLAVVTDGSFASAQIAPTGLPTGLPTPPAPPGANPAPSGTKPAATPAAGTTPAKPATAAKPTAAKPTAAKPAAKPADPRALLTSADKKFKAGDFTGALADYEASNTAKASPEAARGVAQSQDNLGHFAEAVASYEKFLALAPAKMKDPIDEATKRVEAIKAMPGKVHVESTPAGAQVVVDPPANATAAATTPATPATTPATPAPAPAPGAPATTPGTPAPAPGTPAPAASATAGSSVTPVDLELPAGHHTLKLTSEGYEPLVKEIDVTFASKQDVHVDLVTKAVPPPPPPPVVSEAPPPAPTPPAPPPPAPRSKVPAYVTGAVAIVATGVGIGFGVKALSQSSDFDKNPTTSTADDGENNALIADMMFGIAITFGVTSAVLFLTNDTPQQAKANEPKKVVVAKRAPAKITITPAPYVTPHGGGAGAVIRF